MDEQAANGAKGGPPATRLTAWGQRAAAQQPGDADHMQALVARYDLDAGSTDAIMAFVKLIDTRRDLGPKWSSAQRMWSRMENSLAALALEPVRQARRIGDLGSGAGFPGLPLAAVLAQAEFALVESNGERCDFLREACDAMQLSNVTVVEAYLEEWSDGVESCDLVMSRSVAPLDVMVEWAAPLLAPGGATVIWAGHRDARMERSAEKAAEVAGMRLQVVAAVQGDRPNTRHLYLYTKQDDSAPVRRPRATIARRRRAQSLAEDKTFESWDEHAAPIPVPTQQALRRLEWIDRAENLCLCGPSGTGKSHFVQALGHHAVDEGKQVLWHTQESLTALLRRHSGDEATAIGRLVRADLVVIDDIGLLPLARDAAEAIFRLVDAAYEHRSLALTSHWHPSRFDEIMPDALAAATADRFLQHAHVISAEGGRSYRLAEAASGRGVKPLT